MRHELTLSNGQLKNQSYSGKIFDGVNFSGADLCWSNFSYCSFVGANLAGADLRWANFQGANLIDANLSGADLGWVNFTGANISGANFSGADTSFAKFAATITNNKCIDPSRLHFEKRSKNHTLIPAKNCETKSNNEPSTEDEKITLWWGNIGIRTDEYGNTYEVYRDQYKDKRWSVPELVEIYQSLLREIGYQVKVEEEEYFADGVAQYFVRHIISTPQDASNIPCVYKQIGYRYKR